MTWRGNTDPDPSKKTDKCGRNSVINLTKWPLFDTSCFKGFSNFINMLESMGY